MLMNVLKVVLILVSLMLIGVGTVISGKNQANAGSAFGASSSDNYFSKNKNASKDAQLNMLMKVSAILLVVLSVAMVILQG